ncbi:oxygen-insensitive NAD(P)H nitroreductase [Salinibius halmophilus]|uniref:oxygen-insensitive NAD(P)H nitroreductase n=1 Tax=Salinibius halmophilus TaxID=1853216 RepID=UPI000E6720D6|nr:oxygen-insensitive NAD(P)H nitroreductase [Salinibius halmophilus]
MNILSVAKRRYATKAFDPNFVLSSEQLNELRSLLQLSPSSVNSQPWHFYLAVTNAGKARLASAAHGQFASNHPKILNAAAVVAFCVNTDLSDEYVEALVRQEVADGRFESREAAQTAADVRNFYISLHHQLNDVQHWAEKQVYLNVGNFLLGCAAMELDAVPIEGFDQQALNDELGLDDKQQKSVVLVAIGKAATDDFNAKLPKSRWPQAKIITQL